MYEPLVTFGPQDPELSKNNFKRKGGDSEMCPKMGDIKELLLSWVMGHNFILLFSLYYYHFEIFHAKTLKEKKLNHNFKYLNDYYVKKELDSKRKKLYGEKFGVNIRIN